MPEDRPQHNQYQQGIFASEVDEYCGEIAADVRRRLRQIVAAAELQAGERVLDVGTGTGVLIPYFLERGIEEIVGCDLSPVMLRQARERFPHVTFWCGDVVDYVARRPFDAVFFNAMFGNVWSQQETLRKAADLLRSGGRVCISHPLGARFVADLNRRDPRRTPHTLPELPGLRNLAQEVGLDVLQFVDQPELYIALLGKP